MNEATWNDRRQYLAFAALSLGVAGMTGLLLPAAEVHFQRYFGSAPPLLVVAGAAVIGGASLRLLQARDGFAVLQGRASLRGIGRAAGLATLLGGAIILADVFLRYPEDTNVPLPEAVLFYPAIGFVAEIVFHVLPLTLLLLALAPLRRRLGTDRLVWGCLCLTALVEPTFQLGFAEAPLSWIGVYTWGHVFVIAWLQLYVFRRYDFASMYAFRLFYYAYWHIAWGTIRLEVLF